MDDEVEYTIGSSNGSDVASGSYRPSPYSQISFGDDWKQLCASIAQNGGTLMELRRLIIKSVDKSNLEKAAGVFNFNVTTLSDFRLKVFVASKAKLCKFLAVYYQTYK
jgi:hypothetical protein